MGFWNKLGKIALQAAPYVAAPFTGGASLMATGATQKLGQKWAESDAKKAIAKGLAPSKFDKYLGMASMGAGLASSMGMGGAITGLSKAGAAANAAKAAGAAGKVAGVANTASKVSGFQDKLGKIGQGASIMMGAAPRGQGTESIQGGGNQDGGLNGWQGKLAGIAGDVLRSSTTPDNPTPAESADTRAAGYVNGFPVNAGQARPKNLSIIDMGRNAALMSQPWRVGYDVRSEGPNDAEGNPQVITTKNPAIYPNYNPPVQAPPISESGGQSGSIFGDQLTQRYGTARKRNPAPVEEEY
jgi:hypothetical protein